MPYTPSLHDAILRIDLASFIAKCVTTVNPAVDYLHNWHIDVIADRLMAAYQGDISRLLINMPPRYLKSICVSVAWPAWILGHHPTARIIVASYSQSLSIKHSLDCRLVMQSPWYQQLFPETQLSREQNEKSKFMTTQQGFRFATSVGGSVTGEGGDFLIVDDPLNPLQAASQSARSLANDWFDQTFSSRLNDKKKGVIIVVMQRLHQEDLSGHLLAKTGNYWEHLCLGAVAQTPVTYSPLSDSTQIIHPRKAGALLHPEREGVTEINRIKTELGSYGFSAQYQQSPQMQQGGMIEPQWLMRHKKTPENALEAATQKIVISVDTAIKSGPQHDYSVATIWLMEHQSYYLIDLWHKQVEYPELKRMVINLADKWQPLALLIEDKASGQSLLQDIKRETSHAAIPIQPKQDKITRFGAVTALFEAGKVLLPIHAPWLADYELQLMNFPHVAHDDMVDSTSQALSWMHYRKKTAPRVRPLL